MKQEEVLNLEFDPKNGVKKSPPLMPPPLLSPPYLSRSNQTGNPFRGGEPVEGWLYNGIIAFAAIYGVVTLTGAAFLVARRNHRLIKARNYATLLIPLLFNTYMVSLTCASYLIGKTPLMCDILSYTYTFYLPFSALVYLMMFPSIVFADKLNSMKASRVAGEDNGWQWKLRHLITPKFKFMISFIGGVVQCATFVGIHFGGLVLPGGENGVSAPGEELDCYRQSLIVNAGFVIFYMLFMGSFTMNAARVADPFYIRVELMFLTLLYAPLTSITAIYPIAPQIFPEGFDYRWVPVTVSALGFFFALFLPLLMTVDSIERFVLWHVRRIRRCCGRRSDSFADLDEETDTKVFALGQSGDLFKSILENDSLLGAFTEFTIKNWCVENVRFYTESTHFVEEFDEMPPSRQQERAKTIASEFLANAAPLEINIEFRLRERLLKEIREGDVKKTTFKDATKHIYELMKKDSFEKWQRTPQYRQAMGSAMHKSRSSKSLEIRLSSLDH